MQRGIFNQVGLEYLAKGFLQFPAEIRCFLPRRNEERQTRLNFEQNAHFFDIFFNFSPKCVNTD